MVSTWGALSLARVDACRHAASKSSRDPATPRRPTKRGAIGGPYAQRRRLAHRQPQGALSAVARGAERQGATPILTSVTAAYLPRNIRPEVTSITVHPPGVVFQKPFSSGETEIAGFDDDPAETARWRMPATSGLAGGAPGLGRRMFQNGLQTFVWKADDENGDELIFDVFYRREGETSWKTLKSGLTDTLLVWDTASAPNGTLRLEGPRVRSQVESGRHGAWRRARKQQLRHRQQPADGHPQHASARGQFAHRALRRSRRRLAPHARGLLARCPALAERVPAGRHSRQPAGTVLDCVWTPPWPAARS